MMLLLLFPLIIYVQYLVFLNHTNGNDDNERQKFAGLSASSIIMLVIHTHKLTHMWNADNN